MRVQVRQLWDSFIALMEHPLIGLALVVGNTVGGIIGYPFWYGWQLATSPLYFWPFIPDSPTSALLFVPAYVLIRRRKPGWPFLNGLAALANIKYGVWTVAYWYLFWREGGNPGWMGLLLSFTHAVMALEGTYLLHYTRLGWGGTAVLIGWFALQDWADYGPWNLHPGLPDPRLVPAMRVEAMVSTVLLSGLLVFLTWKRQAARLQEGRAVEPVSRG